MPLPIYFTRSAEQDLEDIYTYVEQNDSARKASNLLNQLQELISTLNENPERGNYPKELMDLGIREYRQVYCKPYRVIYRVYGSQILIYLIADGRRNMQALLERRLLSGL